MIDSGCSAECHVGEFQLGIIKALSFALFLPVIDHFSGFVQHLNALVIRDPGLAFELTFESFPGILTWPEEIGGQGAWPATNNLVNGKCHVVGQPENLQQETSLIGLRRVAGWNAIGVDRG